MVVRMLAGMTVGLLGKCPICDEMDFSGRHTCQPVWQVCMEDEPDEWQRVRARDAEEAACTFVANRDSFGEYGQVIDSAAVLVAPLDCDDAAAAAVRYEVYGEICPSYTAHRTPARV